jgi:GT2 family glycosyltransferase
VNQQFDPPQLPVTVIIPYKVDRGWLQHAVDSVPKNVQVILSQGEGHWPANSIRHCQMQRGKYIRWLHEDDMLTPNSIEDAIYAIEEQGADFIHGNAYEFRDGSTTAKPWIPRLQYPTLADMLVRNYIHSTPLLYRREVFDRLGGLDETPQYR